MARGNKGFWKAQTAPPEFHEAMEVCSFPQMCRARMDYDSALLHVEQKHLHRRFSDMTGMKLKTQGSSPKEKYNVYQVHTKTLNRQSQALDVDARGKVTFGEPGGRIRSLGKIWWSQWTYQDVKKSYLLPNYDFWYPFLKISRS